MDRASSSPPLILPTRAFCILDCKDRLQLNGAVDILNQGKPFIHVLVLPLIGDIRSL